MSMDGVEKVYPTEEDLGSSNKAYPCHECQSVFKSESNLTMHLAKSHDRPELLQSSSAQKVYFCPAVSCTYHRTPHFKQLKVLKQHYLKVHSKRDHLCSLCNKGFPSEWFRNKHSEYCNVYFKCCDCDVFYGSYETLKTHSRRKKHNILEKVAYKSSTILQTSKSEPFASTSLGKLILPKQSASMAMLIVAGTSERSSQTDLIRAARQVTQETQTTRGPKPQLNVETQTIGDYFHVKPVYSGDNKSIKTQTNTLSPRTVSCNTSFNLDDFELGNEVQRSSSSTQTNLGSDFIYSTSTSTHDSIHTDTSDLLTDTLDSDYFNCNTETQTDQMFNDELFKYCDYYSNMYTQTCEDLLLGEMAFNNSQTQTVFDDVLRSVESQTIMSQSRKLALSCKDMSHMETQTDVEFKQLLEEINA